MPAHSLDPDEQRRQQAVDDAYEILALAVSMGKIDADWRERLAACARFFEADRRSVQDERASAAKSFIRERFDRTGRPVSATVIAKHLRLGRSIVIKYINPRLRLDGSLTCTERGPRAGWKPLA
jgi:hypothetical protein